MNRTILFRGKSTQGLWEGKWVYGFLTQSCGRLVIQTPITDDVCKYGNGYIEHVVDPETVGQSTENPDSFQTKIWESDIVELTTIRNQKIRGVVKSDGLRYYFIEHNKKFWKHVITPRSTPIKVLGNIFDNPELLNKE